MCTDENFATPLEESVHILNVLNSDMRRHQDALCSLINYNVAVGVLKPLNHLTFQYTVIQASSYLDEYHKHFVPNLNEEQRKYIKPFYKRIRQEINRFPDIKDFRNHISAHNLRLKNRSVPLYHDINTYRVPQNIVELGFLIICMDALNRVINRMFPNANEKVRELIKTKHKSNTPELTLTPMGKEGDEILTRLGQDLETIRQKSKASLVPNNH